MQIMIILLSDLKFHYKQSMQVLRTENFNFSQINKSKTIIYKLEMKLDFQKSTSLGSPKIKNERIINI